MDRLFDTIGPKEIGLNNIHKENTIFRIMMTIALIFASCVIGLLLWQRHKLTRRRPQLPGPRGLPFFGNIFQLDSKFPHIQLTEWGNQYGDLYLLRLLGNNVVVVRRIMFLIQKCI